MPFRAAGCGVMLASLYFVFRVFVEGVNEWPTIAYLVFGLIPLGFAGGLYFMTFSVQVLSGGVEWRGGLRGTRKILYQDMGKVVCDKYRLQLFPKDWDQYSSLRKFAEIEARDFGFGNVLKVDAVVISPKQLLAHLEANAPGLIVKN